jgi:ABC-type uncharacterized transport system YnjBCD substrate-binding protein
MRFNFIQVYYIRRSQNHMTRNTGHGQGHNLLVDMQIRMSGTVQGHVQGQQVLDTMAMVTYSKKLDFLNR